MLVVPRKPLEFYDLDFPEATSIRLSTSVNTQSLITHIALLALWLRTSLSLQCHPELNTFCASPKGETVHCHAGMPWLQKTVSCEESAFHLRPVGYLGTLWHIKYHIWRWGFLLQMVFGLIFILIGFWYQECNFRALWILLNLWWRG